MAIRPIFKAQCLFQDKATLRYPCLLPHHIFVCYERNTHGNQGSCRSHTVGVGWAWCPALRAGGTNQSWAPEQGMHPTGSQGHAPHWETPGRGWRPPCLWFALRLLGNGQLQLKLTEEVHVFIVGGCTPGLQGAFLAMDLFFLGPGVQTPETRKILTIHLWFKWCALMFSSAEYMKVVGGGHMSLNGVHCCSAMGA